MGWGRMTEDAIAQIRVGGGGNRSMTFGSTSRTGSFGRRAEATGWASMERLRGYLMRKPAWGPASLQRMIAARMRADTAALAARFRVREEWESEAAAQRERWAAHLEALGNPPKPRKPRNGVTPEQAAANRKAYQREYQRRRYHADPGYRETRKARARARYRRKTRRPVEAP